MVNLHPVITENVFTGRIGRYVHAFDPKAKATLCGISAYEGTAGFQLSVEPEGTLITCLRCSELQSR